MELARSRGIQTIELHDRDSYWDIPAPECFNMNAVPEAVVGSLDDDYSELAKLLSEPQRASSVDFDRAAALLHLLSEQLSG